MKQRMNLADIDPAAYKAMRGLEEYMAQSELNILLKELIKIRTSQINGCAYCIEMHALKARENGETEKRIYAISAWRESPLFSEEERAVLQLTDELTKLGEEGVKDETYDKVLTIFGEKKLAEIIMQIITINGWNRFAISTRMMHNK
ncbi:carboxymuconolactone decarboxylase family protein [Arachidicoccus soli]|uniref:Carboxymuconolactone decarboxylase family protein n=1 Tax=Arachidicoccus soli TaxID=2341117 RepID=A0A386HLS4_9BACT|nr:carboxymuconolactone decarboxylase family protein [Arachidicoccus soli]AYD46847.1 carboxymuconolactone decarboxylase family protein [Arachidicoccus soli]